MRPVHIVVSVMNLFCGFAFALLLLLPRESLLATFAAPAVVGGYFANLLALIVAAALLLVLVVRAIGGQGVAYVRQQWLGFFNGFVVLAFWGAFILYATFVS